MEYLFPLKDRREIAEGTMAFFFDTSGSDFTFTAGQNCDFTLIDPPMTDAEGNTRTFSIASSPNDKNYFIIATRMRNTAFKNSLKSVPLGTKVKVIGPMGDYTLHKNASRPAVFLIGGIGITPVRSMIKWATEQKLPHKLNLFYSNRSRAATAFLDDFEKWAKQNPNFKFIPTVTDESEPSWKYERGRINEEMIKKYVKDIKNAVFYLSGPPEMVKAMRQLCVAAGADEDSIRTEEFSGY